MYWESRSALNRLLEDVKERLEGLKSFDASSEVNSYCDDLETEIVLAVESAHEHLNKVQERLLTKAREYRSGLLNSRPASAVSDTSRLETERLAKEAEELDEKVSSWPRLRRPKRKRSADEQPSAYECIKRDAGSLVQRIKSAQAEMREDAFASKFMRMKWNELFFLESEQVGRLEIYDNAAGLEKIDSPITIDLVGEYEDKYDNIKRAIFLSDGNLAYTCNRFVVVWNPKTETGVVTFEFSAPVAAVAQLPTGRLACLCAGGMIHLLDAAAGRAVSEVTAHAGDNAHGTSSVYSLTVLRNGDLASACSAERALKIWRVDVNCELTHRLTITADRAFESPLQMLSNGFLVSEGADDLIQVWSPHDGRLVRAIASKSPHRQVLCVLSNDQLVWDAPKGLMTFHFDLEEPRLLIRECPNINVLAELPNALLIAGIFRPTFDSTVFKVIDPRRGLLRQILPGHGGYVSQFAFSRDYRQMVTISNNGAFVIWSLKYQEENLNLPIS